MQCATWRRMVMGCCLASLLLGYASVGAEPKSGKKATAAESKNKRTPRLPPYYRTVVTEEQRSKIAAIQSEYSDEIDRKRDELRILIDKQDAAIFKVLTKAQREEVEKLRTAARERRAKLLGESEGEDAAMEDEAAK